MILWTVQLAFKISLDQEGDLKIWGLSEISILNNSIYFLEKFPENYDYKHSILLASEDQLWLVTPFLSLYVAFLAGNLGTWREKTTDEGDNFD